MNKFIENIIEELKNNEFVYYKAWPTDFKIYKIDLEKNQAFISWGISDKAWFDLNKIYFCCRSWHYGSSEEANVCYQYKQDFDSQFEKTKSR